MKFLRTFLAVNLCAIPLLAQQTAQPQTILLWPNGNPEPSKLTGPEIDPTTDNNRMYAGKVTIRVKNVSQPSITVYPAPAANNSRAAVLVLPGGGYDHLTWNLEGTEVCEWLNSIGITGIAVKYRVPERGRFPAYLIGQDNKLFPLFTPDAKTPPTIIFIAENDHTARVETALVYYQALKDAKVPAELHIYTQGGHGFGIRPTDLPISHWPTLAETWLHTIHILGPPGPIGMP